MCIYLARIIPGTVCGGAGLFSFQATVIGSYSPVLLKRWDGAHRVDSNKAGIVFDIPDAQWDDQWTTWRVNSVLLITAIEVDFGILCAPSFVRIPHSNYFIRFVMWTHSPGNGIPLICIASGLSHAHFVIPTLLRRSKVVHAALDETRSPSRGPQRHQVEEQSRHVCCLAHVVRSLIFRVVANRVQSHSTGENPPWWTVSYSFAACLVVQPLTMHPRLPIFLIATPPQFWRSLRLLF